MKITITGGSGFLGSHVADELSKIGHEVKIFDKKKSKWLKSDQKMYVGDILNQRSLERAVKGADIVFHFAALSDLEEAFNEPIKSVNINVLGTVQALELCKKHKVKRFVYASTIYVNSTDGGFYRSSKKAAEDYVEEYRKKYQLNYTVLRFGSLYGLRSNNKNGVTKIIKNAIKSRKVSYAGSNRSVREYISVSDAAKACCKIIKNKYKNKHINITGKKKIKVSIFLKRLAKILKISKKIEFKNKKTTGHYTVSPFTYKPKSGKKFVFDKSANFFDEITLLVNSIRKD